MAHSAAYLQTTPSTPVGDDGVGLVVKKCNSRCSVWWCCVVFFLPIVSLYLPYSYVVVLDVEDVVHCPHKYKWTPWKSLRHVDCSPCCVYTMLSP
jgi:hypothetical protein